MVGRDSDLSSQISLAVSYPSDQASIPHASSLPPDLENFMSSPEDVGLDDDEDRFLIEFDENEPEYPMNWPVKKKVQHTAFYGLTTFAAQFNSAVISATVPHLMATFKVSREVALLATSLRVRNRIWPDVFCAIFRNVWQKNRGVVAIFCVDNFYYGHCVFGQYGWYPLHKIFRKIFCWYSNRIVWWCDGRYMGPGLSGYFSCILCNIFVTGGVTFGPIIGSLVTMHSDTSWRWAVWVSAFIEGAILILDVTLLSETYSPILLSCRAAKLRIAAGNWAYHARHDEWQLDVKEFFSFHFYDLLRCSRRLLCFALRYLLVTCLASCIRLLPLSKWSSKLVTDGKEPPQPCH
jgi:DHA1 family multidrug resistance protein-like MFS transporter